MNHSTNRGILLLLGTLAGAVWNDAGAAEVEPKRENGPAPFGIAARTAWTTSRVKGSPEPSPPYQTVRVFPKLKFNHPLLITHAPGTDRMFVIEQQGKLYSFPNDPACERPDLLIDLKAEIQSIGKDSGASGVSEVYGLAFHPKFEQNRYCYLCYVMSGKAAGQLPDGTRVSRFKVTEADPPRCDPGSEQVLISWLGGGHNGGCLKFGPDGCLYISTGDGSFPNPPDALLTGQDVSDLLGSILRIDVDQTDGDKRYKIPADNPLVGVPGARGEIWAYGFRNPWKMSFDRVSGDLWVGDVGWELWETVDRVQKGGNYGWSVMEGNQTVRPEGKRGPTPVLPPTIELPHSISASVTGGYVYRGPRLKELQGAYVYGDWETRRMWAARYQGDTVLSKQELVEPAIRVVAFGEDRAGELYVLDYDDGTIFQLAPNDARPQNHDFPRKLSETGLFTSAADQAPAAGVIPFSINAPQWADHAQAERFLALPEQTSITRFDSPVAIEGSMFRHHLKYPADAVLAKTLSLEMERGNPKSRRRIETQLLHFNGRAWRPYSYLWNDEQTDATLVDAPGLDRELEVIDAAAPGGKRKQTWNFAGRAKCALCHNPWAEHTLAFNLAQINRDHDYGGIVDNQLRTLEHIGALTSPEALETGKPSAPAAKHSRVPRLVNPYDPAAEIDDRARAYLHVNCAHCHQMGAGGTADIELRWNVPLEKTKTLGARPMQGTFEIPEAQILALGDPYRSVLFYRLSKLGRGRMPHIGSELLDEPGLRLMHDWIRQLPLRADEASLIDRLRSLEEATALAQEQDNAERELERIARDVARADKRDTVTDEDRAGGGRAKSEAQRRAAERAKGRSEAIEQLLSTTSRALLLAWTIEQGKLPPGVREQAISTAAARPEVQVRDLFETFLPYDKRVKRSGSLIRPESILALPGDAARGKELFFSAAGVQCKNCHRIGDTGSKLGPDLTLIGKKYQRLPLLETILEPSKTIEEKYKTWLVETKQGQIHLGLLVEKTPAAVILRDAKDKEIRIPAKDIEQLVVQRQSIMPELLLRDLTAEQVADLLAYLASLK